MQKKIILGALLIIIAAIIAVFLMFAKNILLDFFGSDIATGLDDASAVPGIFYKDIKVDAMYLDGIGKTVSLKEGEVFVGGAPVAAGSLLKERALRLALFYQWMKEDPLLYELGFDKERVREIIENMEDDNADLMDKIKVGGSIYPFEFLRAFVDASEKGQYFFNDISEKNAKDFILAVEKSAKAYQKDTQEIKHLFENAKGLSGADKKVAYLGGETFTDISIMISDIETMILNGKKIDGEVIKRKKCFLENSSFCERPMENFFEPEVMELNDGVDAKGKFLPLEIVGMSENIRHRGPYEIKSSCWKEGDTHYIYVVDKPCVLGGGICAPTLVLADNAYFSRTSDFIAEEKLLREKGVLYVPQPATVPYGCNNLEYKAKILTLDSFFVDYRNEFIFEDISKISHQSDNGEAVKIFERGLEDEKRFFLARYPSEIDLENLGQTYAYAYAYAAKNNLLDLETREKMLSRYIMIRNKLADFDKTINSSVVLLERFIDGAFWDSLDLPPLYIYSTRSNYALFFINFSKAVWRMEERPVYHMIGDIKNESAIPYSGATIDYKQAVEMYGTERIFEWIDKANVLGK